MLLADSARSLGLAGAAGVAAQCALRPVLEADAPVDGLIGTPCVAARLVGPVPDADSSSPGVFGTSLVPAFLFDLGPVPDADSPRLGAGGTSLVLALCSALWPRSMPVAHSPF